MADILPQNHNIISEFQEEEEKKNTCIVCQLQKQLDLDIFSLLK